MKERSSTEMGLAVIEVALCSTLLMIPMIDARFYIETKSRAPTSGSGTSSRVGFRSRSSRDPTSTLRLYECDGNDPAHTEPVPAFGSSVIDCNEMESKNLQSDVYKTYNFYLVHKPNLNGITITLRGRDGSIQPAPQQWTLGFSQEQFDYPDFDMSIENREFFLERVRSLGIGNDRMDIVPNNEQFINDLTDYLAVTNLLRLAQNSDRTATLFTTFATILWRITNIYYLTAQERQNRDALSRLKTAAAMPLMKMIDPCVVIGNRFYDAAAVPRFSQFCNEHCLFLGAVAKLFKISSSCTNLLGGSCVRNVCVCSYQQSCLSSGTISMRRCNNELRLIVK